MRIRNEDSPNQDYMKSRVDLAYLPEEPDWIAVDSDQSIIDALAQRGINSSMENLSIKDSTKVQNSQLQSSHFKSAVNLAKTFKKEKDHQSKIKMVDPGVSTNGKIDRFMWNKDKLLVS